MRPESLACALVALTALTSRSPGAAFAEPVRIRTSERLAVEDAELYVETRGAHRRSPVLLWLHGGPGGAERPLFRHFNGALEQSFVVAYLDQRGAGRSFDPEADPSRLTVSRHLADLDAFVDHLRQELGQPKVALIGHSWGGALGLLYAQAHPEKLSAVVAVAPVVSTRAGQRAEYEFVLAEVSRCKDEDALARLREIGLPPNDDAAEVLAAERLADRYGAVFHRRPSRAWMLLRGIATGLVTPWEIPRLIRANEVSLEAMNDELVDLDLARSVPEVEVPVVFMLGRHDRHVRAELAASYLEALRAPARKVVWFGRSAHNVPFEEPERFDAAVVSELQALGVAGAPP
jgi:pimeloyl-ACP methyl ester carboxylesterase